MSDERTDAGRKDGCTAHTVRLQGPVSISEKTSFLKISSSLEAARFVFRIIRSLWNLTGTSAAVLPMCPSNFEAIRQFNNLSRECWWVFYCQFESTLVLKNMEGTKDHGTLVLRMRIFQCTVTSGFVMHGNQTLNRLTICCKVQHGYNIWIDDCTIIMPHMILFSWHGQCIRQNSKEVSLHNIYSC